MEKRDNDSQKQKRETNERTSPRKTTRSSSPRKKDLDSGKPRVPRGLYIKPPRKQGAPVGSRELTTQQTPISTLSIPRQKKGELRVLIFGGVSEIGKNMYAIEYEDEILIFDCGLAFAQSDMPGVEYIVPNIQYLEERKEKIKGIVITHGHLDHIGGIAIVAERLGYPTIYTRALTMEFIRKRQEEFSSKDALRYHEVEKGSVIKLCDSFTLRFFAVTHTIPDSMGISAETPLGDVVFTGDLKLTHENGVVDSEEEKEFSLFKDRKILLTMADSTNAERPGFSISEALVIKTIKKIIDETNGRIILASFASQLERIISVIEDAIADGRKVVVQGRSMLTNLTIASEMGLLKVPMASIIPIEKMADVSKNKIVAIVTGAQGQEYSALNRASTGTHRLLKIDKNDTIVFSSSVIPGNERLVQDMKDRLSRQGADMVTYQTSDVHSSGHANREELRWIHSHINAKFFIPIHGYHYMLTAHAHILKELGMPEENIVLPDNGHIIDISADGTTMKVQKQSMPTELTIVDGNAVGVLQDIVIRDRKVLAQDGIFVTIVMVNQRTRKVKKSPDIISRGFIYLRESQDLIGRARILIKKTVEDEIKHSHPINIEQIKKTLMRTTQNFLMAETTKRPIVIPVIFVT